MAKRYSKLPSEIRKLSLLDYEFNMFIASIAHEQEVKANGKKL